MVAKIRLHTAADKHETRRALTYFTRRLKVPEIQKLFINDLKQRIDSIRTPEPSTLSWESVKEVYRAAGDSIVGKLPKGRRPCMSDACWNLIKERKAIKKNIESVTYNQQKFLLKV